MKLRIFKTIGLVAAMVACVGMTAFAAPSPSASATVSNTPAKVVDKNGNSVQITVTAVEAEKAAEIKKEETLKSVLGEDFNANVIVADVKEVTAPAGTAFPLTITFTMKGVTADSKVQILHYNGTAWEKIPTTVGDGTVTGTFNSLSPVAFAVDKTTLASGTATSPKTSATAAAGVAVLGLAAAAGAFGLKKKEY